MFFILTTERQKYLAEMYRRTFKIVAKKYADNQWRSITKKQTDDMNKYKKQLWYSLKNYGKTNDQIKDYFFRLENGIRKNVYLEQKQRQKKIRDKTESSQEYRNRRGISSKYTQPRRYTPTPYDDSTQYYEARKKFYPNMRRITKPSRKFNPPPPTAPTAMELQEAADTAIQMGLIPIEEIPPVPLDVYDHINPPDDTEFTNLTFETQPDGGLQPTKKQKT